MAWHDFSCLIDEFEMSSDVALVFLRLNPVSPTYAYGKPTAGSAAYVVITLNPTGYAVVPRAPKEYLETLSEGDRQRDRLLVWTKATAGGESQLFTIQQTDHARADRVRDTARGLTYVCETQWSYPRQGNVSGVICVLLDE